MDGGMTNGMFHRASTYICDVFSSIYIYQHILPIIGINLMRLFFFLSSLNHEWMRDKGIDRCNRYSVLGIQHTKVSCIRTLGAHLIDLYEI